MKNKLEIFEEEGLYHVYNRANGNEKLFLLDHNYRFFLKKYEEYISPFVDTFCYCLMPNHFHFLIKIKEEKILKAHLQTLPKFQTLAEFDYGLAR